jgi:hypothetical protein
MIGPFWGPLTKSYLVLRISDCMGAKERYIFVGTSIELTVVVMQTSWGQTYKTFYTFGQICTI